MAPPQLLPNPLVNQNGHPPYPDTIFISAERSGMNLVRHFVEEMAGRRTPGKTHLLSDGPLLFHRTHTALWRRNPLPAQAPVVNSTGRFLYNKMVLLIRDPAETFVRAYDKNWKRMLDYCNNISVFDYFRGEKLLITYDELVMSDAAIEKIFDFLGIGDSFHSDRTREVRLESISWYDQHQESGSQTKGRADLLRAHQALLTKSQLDSLWQLLGSRLTHAQMQHIIRWRPDSENNPTPQ